jgi:thiol-disulfide isomerase/thioredoxin
MEATGGEQDENDSVLESEPPSIVSMKPNWSHGEGGKKLNIKGFNFGPKGNKKVVVKIEGETATNVVVKSDSELTCIAPAGSGANVSVKVYVDGMTGKSYDRFEYDPPLVLNSFPSGGVADTKVVINGLNFGAMDHKIKAFIGRVPCKAVKRLSEDSVQCIAPAGFGKNLSVTLKLFGRHQHTRVNKSATFSYPPSSVKSIKPRTVPTEGDWIMIIGNGFGAMQTKYLTGMIGERPCVKTVWISSKKVRCQTPPGVGKNISVSVYVGDGELAISKNILSYQHPTVVSIEPNHAPGSGSNMTIVKLTVTEIGSVRGQQNKTISVGSDKKAMLKRIKRNVTIGGKTCKIVNVTATTISCIVPKGIGYDLPVIVTVENVSSPVNKKALFEYDGPAIASVTPSVVPCVGGKRIIIDGTSFGENTETEDMAVLVGGKDCANVTWVNDTAISCITPAGLGTQREVVVVLKAQPSRPFKAFSYARPNIRSVKPRLSAPGVKNLKFMIRGSNFGPHLSKVIVHIGKQECKEVHFFNDSALSCILPQVRVGKFNVKVTVGGQPNKKNKFFESSPPEIETITPQSGPSRGGYPITIKGINFIKDAHAEHVVSVSGLKCSNVLVSSNTELTCNVPKGIAGIQNITVIVNGNPSEPSQDFAYNSPFVGSSVPNHGNKVGGQRIIIKGRDFGSRRPKKGDLVASVGGKACQKTKWISDSEVECVVPEGEGACKAIQVRVGKKDSQVSRVNTMWHYDNPADAEKSYVQDLDENNFDKIVNGDSPVLIKFCTPKCEHCRALKPIYKELARLLKCKKVVIAAVRADTHPALAKRFALNDFPRLLWFPEGRTQPQGEFQGNAKAEYLLGWLANQMGVKNQLYGNGKVPVDATQPQDQERPLAGGLIGAVQSGMKRCSAKKEAPAPSQK